MNEQLNLFEQEYSKRYAVIFCSNIMKDQFGVIWEQQEIVKSNLTLEAAKILTAKLNGENYSSKGNYYCSMLMAGENFLIG